MRSTGACSLLIFSMKLFCINEFIITFCFIDLKARSTRTENFVDLPDPILYMDDFKSLFIRFSIILVYILNKKKFLSASQ